MRISTRYLPEGSLGLIIAQKWHSIELGLIKRASIEADEPGRIEELELTFVRRRFQGTQLFYV